MEITIKCPNCSKEESFEVDKYKTVLSEDCFTLSAINKCLKCKAIYFVDIPIMIDKSREIVI